MIAPEQHLLLALTDRAQRVAAGLEEALQLLGTVPQTPEELGTLGLVERTAATALLKRVEQLEDVLVRTFRTSLHVLGVDTSDLYVRDLLNRMEKEDVVNDAGAWMDIVRLRNRLAHEYPLGRDEQLARLREAVAARDVLVLTLERTLRFLRRRELIGPIGSS